MASIDRKPYGQVEPNHLSAQRNGQIYAQLPAASTITVLENGQFAKYDYKSGEVNFTGDVEWMLVLNEVKLYEGSIYRESYKDFAMKKDNYTDSSMTPRLFKTMVGDIFTTNTLVKGSYTVGDKVVPGTTGILEKASVGATNDMEWTVVAETTMPDGSAAVKLQRTK